MCSRPRARGRAQSRRRRRRPPRGREWKGSGAGIVCAQGYVTEGASDRDFPTTRRARGCIHCDFSPSRRNANGIVRRETRCWGYWWHEICLLIVGAGLWANPYYFDYDSKPGIDRHLFRMVSEDYCTMWVVVDDRGLLLFRGVPESAAKSGWFKFLLENWTDSYQSTNCIATKIFIDSNLKFESRFFRPTQMHRGFESRFSFPICVNGGFESWFNGSIEMNRTLKSKFILSIVGEKKSHQGFAADLSPSEWIEMSVNHSLKSLIQARSQVSQVAGHRSYHTLRVLLTQFTSLSLPPFTRPTNRNPGYVPADYYKIELKKLREIQNHDSKES